MSVYRVCLSVPIKLYLPSSVPSRHYFYHFTCSSRLCQGECSVFMYRVSVPYPSGVKVTRVAGGKSLIT